MKNAIVALVIEANMLLWRLTDDLMQRLKKRYDLNNDSINVATIVPV